MSDLTASLQSVSGLLTGDIPGLWPIVGLSLHVSALATLIAALIAFPLAALLALTPFPGRAAVIATLNGLMGLPSVVVGLLVYLLLPVRALGSMGILFTPSAMVVAQTLLIMPLMAALARQTLEDALEELGLYLRSLKASARQSVQTILFEARVPLLTVVLAGFGRAAAEVGAVMVVGGNIDGVTRTMTTAIALETSKGDLPLALGLGLVLVVVIWLANAAAQLMRRYAGRLHG